MTGGEIVVEVLKRAGVEAVFGVLSVHNIPIYDAIDRDGTIKAVPARSEAGAATMADGYARAGGRLGVCITSTGVAAANTAGALVEAEVGASPVLHITGQVDSSLVEGYRAVLHQARDQLGVLNAAGKAAFRAAKAEDIAATVQTAILTATTGRPGPVSVEIPIDQQYRKAGPPGQSGAAPPPATPDPAQIEEALALINAAQRPLIWAGGGVISGNAAAILTDIARRWGGGVITSAGGRGAFPEDDPLCIGNFAVDPSLADLVKDADLLLAVGTRFRANETSNWQLPLPPIVYVDVEPSSNYPARLVIHGDAEATLQALVSQVEPEERREWRQSVANARAEARRGMRLTLGPWEQIMDDLRAALPRPAIIARDVTVPATAWGSRLLEIYEPRTDIHSATLSIGLGLPMAIGAALARPSEPVCLLAGDGGFSISLAELATAVQERLNINVVLFNDSGYGILRNLQGAYFDGRGFSVDLPAPDWRKLAEAHGMWAADVRSSGEFRGAFDESLRQPGPTLLALDMESIGPMAKPFTGVARLIPAG